MKTFLLNKENKPIIKWGALPDNVFYEGVIPDGFDLAVNPHQPYIIVDVDKHGHKNGFHNIPTKLMHELNATFHYPTKNKGRHFWLYYTGDKVLINRASKLGIDLRIGGKVHSSTTWVNGGYVKWHPRNTLDIRDCLHLINPTSKELNKWLEELFS